MLVIRCLRLLVMCGGITLVMAGTVRSVQVLAAQTNQQQAPGVRSSRAADYQGLLTQYCVTCHNDLAKTGGLTLQDRDLVSLADDAPVWEAVVRKLGGDFMPPPGRPRPERSTRDAFIAALEQEIDAAAAANPDPGRSPVFHRLNRTEYQNAIRDLLAVDMDLVSLLPPDGQNFGFDNNGDALAFSPLLLDRYLSVSRRVARMAVGNPTAAPVETVYQVPTDFGQDDRIDGLPYGTRGGMLVRHPFPLDAEYDIEIQLARNYNFQVNAGPTRAGRHCSHLRRTGNRLLR